MDEKLVNYYRLRAKEYERIYAKPERQEDLKGITRFLQELFQGKHLLDIGLSKVPVNC